MYKDNILSYIFIYNTHKIHVSPNWSCDCCKIFKYIRVFIC